MGRRLILVVPMLVAVLVISGVALALSACGGGGGSSGSESSDSSAPRAKNLHGEILFTREGGKYGEGQVFKATANGTHIRLFGEWGCCPRFSPDGAKILMAGPTSDGQRITAGIVHADGSHLQRIPIRDPSLNLGAGAWAPDGKQIAVEGWDDSNPDRSGVYIVGVPDGRDLARLTKNPDHDIPMDFSPDGSRVVFLRAEAESNPPTGSLYVANVDGTGLHRITPPAIDVSRGRWSPDGKKIVFAGPTNDPRSTLRVVHPDGTGLRKVFENPKGEIASTPTWSPDGHKIMFALIKVSSFTKAGFQPDKLSVIDEDGKGFAVVLDTPDYKFEPEWGGS
jgi:dipeptidyl aminopeptidase/acylaminoacyl peptidase